MALKYKGAVIHDGCTCCVVNDVRILASDPTGTGAIRRAMKADMQLRWQSLRGLLREVLVTNDMLGLSPLTVRNAMATMAQITGGATKVKAFQTWFDAVLKQQVLAGDASYLAPYIQRAFDKGFAFGESQVRQAGVNIDPNSLRQGHLQHQRQDTIAQLATVELQGVVEAVSQQVVRTITDGLLAKRKAVQIFRKAVDLIDKIGATRTNTIAEFVVVRAFNEATLDVYAIAGYSDVGLIPESTVRARDMADAAKKGRVLSKRVTKGAGSRVSRKKAPSASTIGRIARQEALLSALRKVRVRTAGDDDVCPICEDIADGGPYLIDVARSLIPAHPHCRCTFVPVGDRRFAKDKEIAHAS